MVDDSPYAELFAAEHLTQGLKGRSIRGAKITFLSQAVIYAAHLASMAILGRLLSPDDFGLRAMVLPLAGFVELFKDLGLSMATVQRPKVSHAQISTLFWVNAAVCIVTCACFAALAPGLVRFYGEPRLLGITLVLAVGFLPGGFAVQHRALLRRQMRFGSLAVVEIVSIVGAIVVAVVAARLGAGYWAIVIMPLVQETIGLVVVWSVCRWRPGLPVRRCGAWSMLAFGGHLTGFSLVDYVAGHVDRVLVGRYAGAGDLGQYDRALGAMVAPLNRIRNPVAAVAIPALSRIADEPHRYRRAYFKMLNYVVMAVVPAVAYLVVTSDWVIRILLGPQWTQAAVIFRVVGVGALVMPIRTTVIWLFKTQGRGRDLLNCGIISCIVRVASIVVGLHWGIMGVAAATTVWALLLTPFEMWYCCRRGPVRVLDFMPTLFYLAILGLGVCAVTAATRAIFRLSDPVLGTGVTLAVVCAVMPFVLCVHQQGREMLVGVVGFIRRRGGRSS